MLSSGKALAGVFEWSSQKDVLLPGLKSTVRAMSRVVNNEIHDQNTAVKYTWTSDWWNNVPRKIFPTFHQSRIYQIYCLCCFKNKYTKCINLHKHMYNGLVNVTKESSWKLMFVWHMYIRPKICFLPVTFT